MSSTARIQTQAAELENNNNNNNNKVGVMTVSYKALTLARLFYSSKQPSEGATLITPVLQVSKLRLGEGDLLTVAGPGTPTEVMDRRVLWKVCHKK